MMIREMLRRMKHIHRFVMALIFLGTALAEVPRKEMLQYFENRLIKLMDREAWTSYVKNNPKVFLFLSKGRPISVVVRREKIDIGGEPFKLGVSYLQVYAEAPLERFRTLLEEPRGYQTLYDLDKDAFLGDSGEDGSFEAHIFKRVPIFRNQNYVLRYRGLLCPPFWFQRASLVDDKNDFALRDNLKTLEPFADGTVFREIAIVYPLQRTIRAMWPTLRDITRKELYKIGRRLKCAAETPPPLDEERVRDCQ